MNDVLRQLYFDEQDGSKTLVLPFGGRVNQVLCRTAEDEATSHLQDLGESFRMITGPIYDLPSFPDHEYFLRNLQEALLETSKLNSSSPAFGYEALLKAEIASPNASSGARSKKSDQATPEFGLIALLVALRPYQSYANYPRVTKILGHPFYIHNLMSRSPTRSQSATNNEPLLANMPNTSASIGNTSKRRGRRAGTMKSSSSNNDNPKRSTPTLPTASTSTTGSTKVSTLRTRSPKATPPSTTIISNSTTGRPKRVPKKASAAKDYISSGVL